ncbi:hypothetical protein J2755_000662 [Methanohalophilus levihalophilus]|uniref:hypothetical protein n=1 Tax=Methanohalophilus levihalophilus TaxID=1431282 RepID=UPI001AE0FFAF|nr:hypothetical protein [Methanohalophilus levihalophilus]MBP2029742.1 hypothetical protein [Methanohalophilus levihalophilus]
MTELRACITTPTTVQTNRIRGYSLDILSELQNTVLTGPEIAGKIDRGYAYTKVYLYRLYNYGCIDRIERWSWKITPLGTEILSTNTNTKLGNRRVTEKEQKSNRRVTEESNKSYTTDSSRQLNLSLYTSDPDVTEPERVVVLALASHYEKTGEKYRYFRDMYDFCEQIEISAVGINELLAKLKQEGVIYIRQEKMLGMWKIGLKVNFVERLTMC